MEANPFFRIPFICSILLLTICQGGSEAQSVPCTTPRNQAGLCVAIQRCRNIYKAETSPTRPPAAVASYIKQAACTLPGVTRSVCCQPGAVDPEPTTTPRYRQCELSSTASKQDLLPRDCGLSVTDKLSNANVTKVFAYPWMAVVRYDQNGEIVDGCGGSLINQRYVLTAAHCLRFKRGSVYRLHSVILGEHTKDQTVDCNVHNDGLTIERDCADPVEEFGIESFKVHQDYNRPRFSNDIGLIRLDRDVTIQDHIRPICLPVLKETQRQVHERYIVTGWGTTERGTESKVLLAATLNPVDIAECRQKVKENKLNIQLSDKQMCAGGKDLVDACKGDSGGPLAAFSSYNGVRLVQYGIVSNGIDSCGGKNVPGVYCRVASYMDWILDQIEPSC